MVWKLSSRTLLIAFSCLLVCAGANAQDKSSQAFTLANGQYLMKATYKFSDREAPVVDAGGTVTVSVKGNEMSIAIPLRSAPIVATLSGNKFRGQLQEAGVSVEFSGEIVENNHIEGVFTGSLGTRKVNGLWTMKLSKKDQGKSGIS